MILAQSGYMLQPTIELTCASEAMMFHNPFRTTHGGWNPLGARRGVSASDRVKSFLKLTNFRNSDSHGRFELVRMRSTRRRF